MATNDKPTIVDGKPTGDYTKNGKYNIHGDDGKFAPKDSASSGEENEVEIVDKSPFETFLSKTKYAGILERIKSLPDVAKREEALKRIEELINQEIENNNYLNNVHSLNNYVVNRQKIIANNRGYFGGSSYTSEQRKILTKKLDECLENSDFCMRASITGVLGILTDNKFKNQIELGTGHSHGMDNPQKRMKFSKMVFGTQLEWGQEGYKEVEKYGFFDSKDPNKKLDNRTATQYGEVIFTFKKDRVKNRTTYTMGDSLNMSQAPCLFDEDADEFVLEQGDRNPGKLMSSDFQKCKDAQDLRRYFLVSYMETQYHGHLNVSDDVESMLIRKSSLESNKKQIYDLINKNGYNFEILTSQDIGDGKRIIQKAVFKEDGSLEYIDKM